MPRDAKGKNRKHKHNREKNEDEGLTPEQWEKIKKLEKGVDIEEEEEQ